VDQKQDDPARAAREMRQLQPKERDRRIAYGVLQGVVVDLREVFWDIRQGERHTRIEGVFF
jgi:hypothetical protein